MVKNIFSEFRIIFCEWWIYLLVYMFPLLFLFILFFIGEPYIYQIMNDPITVLNGEVWTGLGSNLGILFWFGSAVVSIFSGICLFVVSKFKKESHFLFSLGSLTLLLSLDDLFLLHDIVLPHFGINEFYLYIFYAASGIYILFRYIYVISKYENVLFFVGGLMFCGSILFDLIPATSELGFLEDSFKFVGILSWSVYLLRFSYGILVPLLSQLCIESESD